MAALERYYLSKGIKVAGYDRTATDLTRALADEGVEISYEQGADVIPDYCRNAADTLVVYTAAMPPSYQTPIFFDFCYIMKEKFF